MRRGPGQQVERDRLCRMTWNGDVSANITPYGTRPEGCGRTASDWILAMTEAEIYRELTVIFHDVFGDDSIVIGPETAAPDIPGWDSFNHINLIVAIEQSF